MNQNLFQPDTSLVRYRCMMNDDQSQGSEAGVPRGSTPPLFGIFGTGRCGTTWLGAIVNAHPEVAYRFEPYARARRLKRIGSAFAPFERGEGTENDLELLYGALLRAHPLIEKPPFFPKRNIRAPGRTLLWPLCAKVLPCAPLFEWLYTPSGAPPVVFKEVGKPNILRGALASTSMRVVFMVRHPSAVVASMVRGQEAGVMTKGRLGVLQNLLRKHDEELFAAYGDRVDELDPYTANALLWRVEMEQSLASIETDPKVHLIVYEALCMDPYEESRLALRHFDIAMHPQVEHFIDRSTRADRRVRRTSGEFLIRRYFSVFRDPRESMSKWKHQLTDDQRKAIMRVVEPSSAFQFCRSLGFWDD